MAIERWRVQAAMVLLGLEDPGSEIQQISITDRFIVTGFGDYLSERTDTILDDVSDTRLHVLGIDPENGNAELNPVADGDVTFFTGAGMYLDGLTKHANGTLMPIFKKADPE
jgi:hypothetical protein